MKPKIFFLISGSLASISCSTAGIHAQSPSDTSKSNSITLGRWSPECSEYHGFNYLSSGELKFEINSNQIYIKARLKPLINNQEAMFLVAPYDLGAGGMRLPWPSFSKIKPIAIIKKI